MARPRSAANVALRRPVGTWLTEEDSRKLSAIAKNSRVSVAAYLRAVVVDAIADTPIQELSHAKGSRTATG